MRRELKEVPALDTIFGITSHKAYPDEKGTESPLALADRFDMRIVTRHIPMRRELKVRGVSIRQGSSSEGHKAYPDEKGTESYRHARGGFR